MKSSTTEEQISRVATVVQEMGFRPHVMPGATRTAIGITGNPGVIDPVQFENLPGWRKRFVSANPTSSSPSIYDRRKRLCAVGDAKIGGDELAIIAGPCAIESREQAFAIAEAVRRSGAKFFRGGAYKPRTSPYAFQGLGEEGLKILADMRQDLRSKDRYGSTRRSRCGSGRTATAT